MRIVVAALAALITIVSEASAQTKPVMSGDGYEAFPRVTYQGGDSRFPNPRVGVLVLRDSTLSFHPCPNGAECGYITTGTKPFADSVIFTVNIREIRELAASTQTRSPGVGRRIMFGVLANDRSDELFSFAFDGQSTAEAPVFKTMPTQAGAIEAKVRFRMRRLGIELPATP